MSLIWSRAEIKNTSFILSQFLNHMKLLKGYLQKYIVTSKQNGFVFTTNSCSGLCQFQIYQFSFFSKILHIYKLHLTLKEAIFSCSISQNRIYIDNTKQSTLMWDKFKFLWKVSRISNPLLIPTSLHFSFSIHCKLLIIKIKLNNSNVLSITTF
jgi:hypothetical protein